MSEPHVAVRWRVSGLVQGVGYRWYVLREVERLAVGGWVCNLPDGRVEVVARGPASTLDRLDAILRDGPRMARVENVEKSHIPHEDIDPNTFHIR